MTKDNGLGSKLVAVSSINNVLRSLDFISAWEILDLYILLFPHSHISMEDIKTEFRAFFH